jgi:hypothetical protein
VFDAGPDTFAPGTALRRTGKLDSFELDALRAARAIALGRRLPVPATPRIGRRVLVVIDPRRAADASYRAGVRASTFADALGPDTTLVVREAEPRVLASRTPLDAARWAALAADVTVTHAIDEGDLRAWVDADLDSGVFRWTGCGKRGPTRYVRKHVPIDPIRIHELPESTQVALRSTRFALRFERETAFFAEDHFARATLVTPRVAHEATTTRMRDAEAAARARRLSISLAVALGIHALALLVLRAGG